MEKVNLKAYTREENNGKAKLLRAKGYLPAVLYGSNITGLSLKVKKGEFEKVYEKAGESTLVDLQVDEKPPVKVLIYDVQKEPIHDRINHIDFFQVDMKKKVTTEIPLEFIGESKAIRELGAALIKHADNIEVECLPEDLVSEIKVDISPLSNFDDSLKVKDLVLPKGVTALADGENIIVSVVEPKAEEEPVAAVKPEDVEVIGKGKEEKEGAEGAAEKEKTEK